MLYKKIVIAIAVLFLSACASSSNSVPATEITVDMNEFLYAPASITIPANQPVILTFTNSGAQEHDFVIKTIAVTNVEAEGASSGQAHHMGGDTSEYDLHISTGASSTSKLSFIATEPGTYKIFCSIQGHEVAGMIGELIVVSQ